MAPGTPDLPPVDAPLSPDAYVDVLAQTGMGMVCILERDGTVAVFDAACERATGFAAADVVGRDARETVIPPEEADAFGEFLGGVALEPSPSPQLGHWLTAAGARLLVAWSNRPLYDDAGEISGILTVGIDLTERERVSAELRALHAELHQRLVEQAALRRVATLVAGDADLDFVFATVAAEVADVAGSDASAVVRYERGDVATVLGHHGDDGGAFPVGGTMPIDPGSAVARARVAGEGSLVAAADHEEGVLADVMRAHGFVAAAAAPVLLAGTPWGAIVVVARSGLAPETPRRLAAFGDLLALGIAGAEAREQVLESRARLVKAADEERRRLERDLHDGAQQRLVSLALNLAVARRSLDDVTRVTSLLEAAERDAREALNELRSLARGLHPPILSERGLPTAVDALARRAPLPVDVEHVPAERFSPTLEVAAYYVVAEALTNVAKHAQAARARVALRVDGARLVIVVADDGRGGADPRGGSGLRGLVDRVEALRGTLDITSSPAAGTTLRAELPLHVRG